MSTRRAIMHVDMDAFFASVTQRDEPGLQGKPVIIGGHSTKRGVVASASYEARSYGVRSAMPLYRAMELCPQAILRPVEMGKYREINQQLREIWERWAPVVEPIGFDEAYLDLSQTEALFGPPEQVAYSLQAEIRAETRLIASVGLGTSKLLAKIASKAAKPAGVMAVPAGSELEWLHPRDVALVPGVGPRMQERLHLLGIRTIGQLAAMPLESLTQQFGQQGADLYLIAHGKDPRPVEPSGPPKSIGSEETFDQDHADPVFLRRRLLKIVCELGYRLRRHGYVAATLSTKVRYAKTFETVERSKTILVPSDDDDCFYQVGWELLTRAWDGRRPLRLLGASLSNFKPNAQLSLFAVEGKRNAEALYKTLDKLRSRYGMEAVTRGATIGTASSRKG